MATDLLKTLQKLPLIVYSILPSDPNQIIALKRGEEGYFPFCVNTSGHPTIECVAELNGALYPKPTPAQIEAMVNGSLFGFTCRAADPDYVEGLFARNPKAAAEAARMVK